jgi:hypothetical protein
MKRFLVLQKKFYKCIKLEQKIKATQEKPRFAMAKEHVFLISYGMKHATVEEKRRFIHHYLPVDWEVTDGGKAWLSQHVVGADRCSNIW